MAESAVSEAYQCSIRGKLKKNYIFFKQNGTYIESCV